MATVILQVTARCQYWARSVPWWQPMKIPYYSDRLSDQNCFAFGNENEWWASHYGVIEFLIGQFILEVTFSIRNHRG